eukprot:12095787-Ditylum_brightwellii.AAC.1
MCYFIKTEGEKKPQYLTKFAICSQCKNIGTDKEYVSEEFKHQPELEELELGFFKSNYDPVEQSLEESLSLPKNVDSGETETSDNPPDGGSNGLDTSGSRELEKGEPKTEEALMEENDDFTDADLDLDNNLPLDIRSDPDEGVDDLYNEQDVQEGDYELDVIVDHHLKNGALILKARYYSDSSDVKDV